MKKLLHEKISEWVDESKDDKVFISAIAMIDVFRNKLDKISNLSSEEIEQKLFEYIAEEIERQYIPKPRFEDGEPVDWSDGIEIEWDNDGNWGFNAVSKLGIPLAKADDCIVAEAVINDYGLVVRKPKPKVLDADGVEIKVGDTVWDIKCHNCMKHTVIDIIHDDDCIICDDKLTYTAHLLTHKEPDSLEKLCDDLAKWLQKYTAFTPYEAVESIGEEIIERIGKLIERSEQ